MSLNTKEAPVQKAVIEALHFWGFRAFRINSGLIETKAGRMIRLAPAGTSDVLGMVPTSGRLIAIEVKRPGAASHTTEAQEEFLSAVAEDNGVALVIDDVRRLDSILCHLRADPYAKFTIAGDRLP